MQDIENIELAFLSMDDYRKELSERLNLKGVAFGGRIPNYQQ